MKIRNASLAIATVVVVAATAMAPKAEAATCKSWSKSTNASTLHKARQGAILGVNRQWNAEKASWLRSLGVTAARLNYEIQNKLTIHPIKIKCQGTGCRAVKTVCRK